MLQTAGVKARTKLCNLYYNEYRKFYLEQINICTGRHRLEKARSKAINILISFHRNEYDELRKKKYIGEGYLASRNKRR